jgi:tetratricopeptide (TPR) repeat protein
MDPARSLRAVAEALRLARKLGDRRSEAQSLSIATTCHYLRGDYVSAVATGIDACATFPSNDIAGRSYALQGVALAFFSVSDYVRARGACERAILYGTIEGEPGREASARNVLGYVLAESGHHEEALAEFRLARKHFRKLGDAVRAKKMSYNMGHTWSRRGDEFAARDPGAAKDCWRRAMRFYRAALATAPSRLDDAISLSGLGKCALELEQPRQALEFLERASNHLARRDPPRIVSNIACWRGRAESSLGKFAQAEHHLLQALKRADELENDDHGVKCREAMADLAERRGQPADARQWRAEAEARRSQQRESLDKFRREMGPLWDGFLKRAEI